MPSNVTTLIKTAVRVATLFASRQAEAKAQAAEANDYKMSSFILGVIKSDAFQLKRAEAVVSQ